MLAWLGGSKRRRWSKQGGKKNSVSAHIQGPIASAGFRPCAPAPGIDLPTNQEPWGGLHAVRGAIADPGSAASRSLDIMALGDLQRNCVRPSCTYQPVSSSLAGAALAAGRSRTTETLGEVQPYRAIKRHADTFGQPVNQDEGQRLGDGARAGIAAGGASYVAGGAGLRSAAFSGGPLAAAKRLAPQRPMASLDLLYMGGDVPH